MHQFVKKLTPSAEIPETGLNIDVQLDSQSDHHAKKLSQDHILQRCSIVPVKRSAILKTAHAADLLSIRQ